MKHLRKFRKITAKNAVKIHWEITGNLRKITGTGRENITISREIPVANPKLGISILHTFFMLCCVCLFI